MTFNPEAAIAHLRASDPVMAAIIDRVGPFAMRSDSPDPFRALARAIIFQQLSGAAAGTIYGRLLALFEDRSGRGLPVRRSSPDWDARAEPFPAPEALLDVPLETLRSVGLSRQKATYLQTLSAHFAACESCPDALYAAADADVIAHLTAIKGVGRWTAEMFLIFHLRRPDVLPVNDVGINRAIMRAYGLGALPTPPDIVALGEPWRPYASVACWYLWRSEDVALPMAPASPAG